MNVTSTFPRVFLGAIRFSTFFLCLLFAASSSYAHPDVWLKNSMGDRITPRINTLDPYSPRRTCGSCHNYRLITSGYHFTQGFEAMSDRYGGLHGVNLSPGMFGRWLPTAAVGRLSPKANESRHDLDLSTYDWIGHGGKYGTKGELVAAACGFCHPGGGPLEYGRNRTGKADYSRTLEVAEGSNWPRFDGDYSSLDTPTGKSLFALSGVVEADCFICHLDSYDLKARNMQLSKRNYRWAATAGARLGTIRGSIFTYANPAAGPEADDFLRGTWQGDRRPTVMYRWSDTRLFTKEGRLKGAIIAGRVATRNCLQCHELSERKNTGTIHHPTTDVHLKTGFNCTDCHPLVETKGTPRLRHQIAKGHSPTNTVRDDLDGIGMATCVGCHLKGQYGKRRASLPISAPDPRATHAKKFSGYQFHTFILDCMACHATPRQGRALLLLDMSAGYEATYTTDRMEPTAMEADYLIPTQEPWTPWMMQRNRYEPATPKWLRWFGNDEGGNIVPIPLRYVKNAAQGVRGMTTIKALSPRRKGVKYQTPTDDETVRSLLIKLKRLGFSNPVYVDGNIYRLGKDALLVEKVPDRSLYYTLAHGVGRKGALGTCGQCHAPSASFFTRKEVVDMRGFFRQDYPIMKEPHAIPQYKLWGMKDIPMP